MAYDEKYRLAVIKFKDSGHTFKETHEIFGVDPQCYYRWKKQACKNGSVKNNYPKTHKGKIDPVKLLKLLAEHPNWYLEQFAGVFGVCRRRYKKDLPNLGLLVKKTFTYSEKSEEKREEYLRLVTHIPEENRVYVDECGIKEHLKREYGRALRGVKVKDVKRGHDFHRVNTVAAVIHGKAGAKKLAPLCYYGSMKAGRFERWIERDLLKTIGAGKTIIMDNAGFHRKKQLNEIRGKAGVGLLFLPPYSLTSIQ